MKILPFIFILGITNNLFAQSFSEAINAPFEGAWYGSIAFADVDGDNDQDVLITGEDNTQTHISKLYLNDGSGNYTEDTNTPFIGVDGSAVAFADIDDDDDNDLVITGLDNSNSRVLKLYTNDGDGNFTEVSPPPVFEEVFSCAIAFEDVDGDTDFDLLITGSASSSRISKLYINDGSGNYTEDTNVPFVGVEQSSVAFADVDGDTDKDLLITGLNNSSVPVSKLYMNDGNGNFTENTSFTFEGVNDGSIAFSDVDGVNGLDVLITGFNGNVRTSKLYLNNGSGTFAEAIGTPFEGVQYSSVAFADVDGDTDQDVLVTGESISNNISKLYINDGQGVFTEATGDPFEGIAVSSIAFADVDGDTDQDVLISGDNDLGTAISKLYLNNSIVTSSSSLTYENSQMLVIYPNPNSSNILYLDYHSDYTAMVELKIYSIEGKLVRQAGENVSKGVQTLSVDLGTLSTGTYFVEVLDEGRTERVKFVIE